MDNINGKIAFVFPGQGAQYPGMGRELFEQSPAAREVFEMAENIRPGTIEQCFSGSAEQLARTVNTQPCLYCADLAAAEALRESGIAADMLAGFSLGEFAALAFSGAVTYEDGFRMVCERADLMEEACKFTDAGMVAVLKLPDYAVKALCGEFERIYPVNFNYEGQIVVSGEKDELEPFTQRVKESGGKVMPLKVGGAFHSPLMNGAAALFAEKLEAYNIGQPGIPVYSNVTALPYDSGAKELLAKQICSPVQWRSEVENMIAAGAGTFIEAGPGKTLCGMVSRISDKARVFNTEDRTEGRLICLDTL